MPTEYDERQIALARWVIDRFDAGGAGPRRTMDDLERLANAMDDQDLGDRLRQACWNLELILSGLYEDGVVHTSRDPTVRERIDAFRPIVGWTPRIASGEDQGRADGADGSASGSTVGAGATRRPFTT